MARAKTPKQLDIKIKSLKKQIQKVEAMKKKAMAAAKKKESAKKKVVKKKATKRKKR